MIAHLYAVLCAASAAPASPTMPAEWQAELTAAVTAAERDAPAAGEALRRLRGLDPAHYLSRRRPDPEVGRELKPLAEVAWPWMLELLRQDPPAYPFAPRDAYPTALSPAAFAELRAREVAALRVGLIGALGEARAPLALPLLLALLADPGRAEPERRAAALAAGELARDLRAPLPATLLAVADDPATSAWLRAGALIGVAKAGGAEPASALAALTTHLRRGETAATRQAAVTALAVLAAGPRLRADPLASTPIAELLTGELAEPRALFYEGALTEALAVVGQPAAAALERLAADGRADPLARARAARALAQVRLALGRR